MKKVGIVIRKEYSERVTSAGFIITTILIPVLMISVIAIPILIQLFSSKSDVRVAIIDKTKALKADLTEVFSSRSSLQIVFADFADAQEREVLIKETDLGKLNGYLVIQHDSTGKILATYTSKNVTDFDLLRELENSVKSAVRRKLLVERGFADADIELLEKPMLFKTQKLSGGQASSDSGLGSFLLSFVMALLIYSTIIGYGAFISSSVIGEKSSKVMEILISSVKPFELMIGKIIGIGLVALTQYAVWVIAALALSGLSLKGLGGAASKINFEIPPLLLFYFVLYFVLGYLIYATLYAATGSIFENEQDAQSLQFPITFLVILAMVFVSLIISKPDSPLATLLSLVPFFAPILMIGRLSVTDVPLWQILLSLVLMAVTFYAILWGSAKIYRIGVLLYGKKPSLNEVMKWLRYA
jgi:ABC-2 type transport system permease protein